LDSRNTELFGAVCGQGKSRSSDYDDRSRIGDPAIDVNSIGETSPDTAGTLLATRLHFALARRGH
jgi:hypothetical protein